MRWGHGHTFLGGLVAGLVLDRHALVLFGAGVLLGVLAVLVVREVAGLLRWARHRLEGARS
jgi:hypothetical protein